VYSDDSLKKTTKQTLMLGKNKETRNQKDLGVYRKPITLIRKPGLIRSINEKGESFTQNHGVEKWGGTKNTFLR